MKKAIITLANNKIADISAVSHPILRRYADWIGADFIIINKKKINAGSFHWEKFQCYDLLKRYDRILILDSDILISPDCPNLFRIVPENKIGTIFEDRYRRKKHRRMIIRDSQKQLGDLSWERGYINTGVFVCSKIHRDIFKLDKNNLWDKEGMGYDDVQIGHSIKKLGFEVFELNHKFNHMSSSSEMGKNRFFSYIIHYAGTGFSNKIGRVEQMRRDYIVLRKNKVFRCFYDLPNRFRLILRGIYGYLNL